jgi:hypothetical protein
LRRRAVIDFSGVILRPALARVAKDGHADELHPSRLAEVGEHLRMTVVRVATSINPS